MQNKSQKKEQPSFVADVDTDTCFTILGPAQIICIALLGVYGDTFLAFIFRSKKGLVHLLGTQALPGSG